MADQTNIDPSPRKSQPSSLGIGILACLGSIGFFYFASEALIPIVLAVFLYFILEPGVRWAKKRRVPPQVSAPAFAILLTLVTYGIGWGAYGEFAHFIEQMPQYSGKIRHLIRSFEGKAAAIQKGTEKLLPKEPVPEDSQKVQVVSSGREAWSSILLHGVNSLFAILTDLILIPILAVFFLLERDYLRNHFVRSLGPTFPLERVNHELSRMVGGYFFGNLIVGLMTSLGFFLLFIYLGLDEKIPLALFAGFLNLIPVFGALFGALLPAAQAILQFDDFSAVAVVFAASVFLHFFVNNIVIPKMVGSKINVNAASATIGLIFWGWLWGGLGLLIAIPMMAVIRIGLSSFNLTAPWANLIAENPDFNPAKLWLPQRRGSLRK